MIKIQTPLPHSGSKLENATITIIINDKSGIKTTGANTKILEKR